MQRAFSLVELSIVLVILGLLTGGILAGQSLIRASELRSVMTQMSKDQVAFKAFKDKYFGIAGDLSNATKFWGTDTGTSCTNAPVAGDRVAKTATCDGNGDGQITANTFEELRAWQHLANAGLIEGSFTGVSGPGSTGDNDPGVNAPALKLGNSTGVSVYWVSNTPAGDATTYIFEGSYGNSLTYGRCGSYDCFSAFTKPEEAWNIDTKLDDGKPGTGKIVTRVACAIGGCMPNCNSATTNAAGQAAAATYLLEQTSVSCGIMLRGAI